jgi:hypothetical protein
MVTGIQGVVFYKFYFLFQSEEDLAFQLFGGGATPKVPTSCRYLQVVELRQLPLVAQK